MVSLWPWKGDDSSPAAFEKALSDLSSKISKASSNLASTHQQARRFKALWTLYSGFAYLLFLTIAALVVGWQNWGSLEVSGVAGGPVLIYLVRLSLSSIYSYRTSKQQAYVDALQKQREDKINKLKAATKYDTTQQLLEKYGGAPKRVSSQRKQERESGLGQTNTSGHKRRGTIGFVPPPTANIPERRAASLTAPNSPQMPPGIGQGAQVSPYSTLSTQAPGAEFAPNAFEGSRQYAPLDQSPSWYDRLMDVVLGEDESSPRNRLALICQKCRLVNGQAPPGVKTLEDVGKWRCSSCGTMNGADPVAEKLVADITKEARRGGDGASELASPVSQVSDVERSEQIAQARGEDSESDVTQYSEHDSEDGNGPEAPISVPEQLTRRRTRQSKAADGKD